MPDPLETSTLGDKSTFEVIGVIRLSMTRTYLQRVLLRCCHFLPLRLAQDLLYHGVRQQTHSPGASVQSQASSWDWQKAVPSLSCCLFAMLRLSSDIRPFDNRTALQIIYRESGSRRISRFVNKQIVFGEYGKYPPPLRIDDLT